MPIVRFSAAEKRGLPVFGHRFLEIRSLISTMVRAEIWPTEFEPNDFLEITPPYYNLRKSSRHWIRTYEPGSDRATMYVQPPRSARILEFHPDGSVSGTIENTFQIPADRDVVELLAPVGGQREMRLHELVVHLSHEALQATLERYPVPPS